MTSQTKITNYYGVRSSVEANLAKATPRCLESTSPKLTGSPTLALGIRGRTRRKEFFINTETQILTVKSSTLENKEEENFNTTFGVEGSIELNVAASIALLKASVSVMSAPTWCLCLQKRPV